MTALKTGVPAHNLPTPPTTLLGREHELAEVGRLLRDGVSLLTLTGPAGIGKTRLAIAAATEALDVFPGGVWLVDLAPLPTRRWCCRPWRRPWACLASTSAVCRRFSRRHCAAAGCCSCSTISSIS